MKTIAAFLLLMLVACGGGGGGGSSPGGGSGVLPPGGTPPGGGGSSGSTLTPSPTPTPKSTTTPPPTPTPTPTSVTVTIGSMCGPASGPSGYRPCDIQSAYSLPAATNGSGQTIAIVDAFDDPTAESDLATYRSTFGEPACTTSNGCFRKLDQNGGTNYPAVNNSWAGEISLDLDMVSATCPRCNILLLEANSASNLDSDAAVSTAVALHANVVTNSYGSNEYSSETSEDSVFNHPGTVFVASSGDTGYNPAGQYPAASPYVTAVGGTTLAPGSVAGVFVETAWIKSGSFCSNYEAKPPWQTDVGCPNRTAVDLAAVADPNTGVAVYQTTGGSGWMIYGGTSASAPIIAGAYALAGNSSSISDSSWPYKHPGGVRDILTGTNGVCTTLYVCTALPGYDGPTGLGVPSGLSSLSLVRRPQGASSPPNIFSGPSVALCTPPPPGFVSCHAYARTDVGHLTP